MPAHWLSFHQVESHKFGVSKTSWDCHLIQLILTTRIYELLKLPTVLTPFAKQTKGLFPWGPRGPTPPSGPGLPDSVMRASPFVSISCAFTPLPLGRPWWRNRTGSCFNGTLGSQGATSSSAKLGWAAGDGSKGTYSQWLWAASVKGGAKETWVYRD